MIVGIGVHVCEALTVSTEGDASSGQPEFGQTLLNVAGPTLAQPINRASEAGGGSSAQLDSGGTDDFDSALVPVLIGLGSGGTAFPHPPTMPVSDELAAQTSSRPVISGLEAALSIAGSDANPDAQRSTQALVSVDALVDSAADTVAADSTRQAEGHGVEGGDARGELGVEQLRSTINVLHDAARSHGDSIDRARLFVLSSPVGTPRWSHELATRLSWLVDRGEQVASLHLIPEDIGPVAVRLTVREGEVSVWFGAAHAEARAAIEQALPRLREMLAGMGLALANADVSNHSRYHSHAASLPSDAGRATAPDEVVDRFSATEFSSVRGLIDDYA